jgi:hypothetical protein
MSAPTYDTAAQPFFPSEAGARALAKYSRDARNTRKLARALGWFSIALGLAELAAPKQLARTIGTREYPRLLPLFGLREIGAGITILAQSDPTAGVTARVAGDVLDLAFLATELAATETERGRVAAATAAVLGVTALDVTCAIKLRRTGNSRT